MRFAYADPPYVGQARRCYGCQEVDHPALIRRLVDEFPDGWALSCLSQSLRTLLPLCPEDVRVAAWCKTWTALVIPVKYQWEPVIWRGGRKGKFGDVRARDWHQSAPAMAGRHGLAKPEGAHRRRDGKGNERGFVGAKPSDFCVWVFRMLGARPGDELVDLFPGTGAVSRAWEHWTRQGVLWAEAR